MIERARFGGPSRAGAAALSALLAAGIGAGAPSEKTTSGPPPARHGPGRERIAYTEKEPEAKAALLKKINEERAAADLPTLKYDLFAAKVGDEFCLDSAANGTVGHWDLAGRGPHLRWAQAGGVDYHGQNAGSISRTGAPIRSSEITGTLLESHARMMAERPPDDGHRQMVLNPIWTHVGIGVAAVGGEFRMTEEYSRRIAEWVEIPSAPVRAGSAAWFVMKLPSDWNVGAVEVAYEKFPRPLSSREIAARRTYRYPSAVSRLLPILGGNLRHEDGRLGDFRVVAGRLDVRIPLSSGPGDYYVMAYAARGNVFGWRLAPITAALIVAE